MHVSLETLELTPQQFEAGMDAVRRMAYINWLDAGQPEGAELECWIEAEREWIERCYVPARPIEIGPSQSSNASPVEQRETPQRASRSNRRRTKASAHDVPEKSASGSH